MNEMFAPVWALSLLAAQVFAVTVPTPIPPPPASRLPGAGIPISASVRAELTAGAAELQGEIHGLKAEGPAGADPADMEIFAKAVDWALRYDEFFRAEQVTVARHLLAVGRERAAQWRAGRAPWLSATGPVIRGYRSALDGS